MPTRLYTSKRHRRCWVVSTTHEAANAVPAIFTWQIMSNFLAFELLHELFDARPALRFSPELLSETFKFGVRLHLRSSGVSLLLKLCAATIAALKCAAC